MAQTGAAGDPGAAAQTDKSARPSARKSSDAVRRLAIVLTGALLTGALGGWAFTSGLIDSKTAWSGATPAGPPTLSALPIGELDAAMATLDPAASKQPVADAKNCKVPMASVTLVKQAGSADGMIRIRSGSYLSPPFQVTDVPQRVAIPFPAPYPTGRGALSVIGEADGVTIFLSPGWFVQSLNGAASIAVWWTPGNPC
jgi:hypothetical protein